MSRQFRVYWRQFRDARCDVHVRDANVVSSSVLHPNVCQRPRILLRFSCSFSSLFSFLFFGFRIVFESIAFFEIISTVNPRSLPLETIPFRLKSVNRESVTILARIFSNGSVVNVVSFLFFFFLFACFDFFSAMQFEMLLINAREKVYVAECRSGFF